MALSVSTASDAGCSNGDAALDMDAEFAAFQV